jgi:hypothetical protein
MPYVTDNITTHAMRRRKHMTDILPVWTSVALFKLQSHAPSDVKR